MFLRGTPCIIVDTECIYHNFVVKFKDAKRWLVKSIEDEKLIDKIMETSHVDGDKEIEKLNQKKVIVETVLKDFMAPGIDVLVCLLKKEQKYLLIKTTGVKIETE